MKLYYGSNSRRLEVYGPASKGEVEAWLDEECIKMGMEAGDWQQLDYWQGLETPPRLHTEAEWLAMLEENSGED